MKTPQSSRWNIFFKDSLRTRGEARKDAGSTRVESTLASSQTEAWDRRRFLSAAFASLAVSAMPASLLPAASPLLPQCLDFHFHGGLEREPDLSLEQWVMIAQNSRQNPPPAMAGISKADWLKRRESVGRSCFLIVDHLELYRPERLEITRRYVKKPRYPLAPEGRKEFIAEVDALRAARKDLIIFSGWEALETDFDTGLDMEALEMVDCVGWHIGKDPGGPVPRAKQICDLQKKLAMPMIMYHPFRQPVPKEGDTVASLRQLSPDQQKQLIDLLGDSSVYLEINISVMIQYWPKPLKRQAFIDDLRPLVEAGLEFAVGSDWHRREDIEYYEPERYLADLGIHARQVTGIVGDLLTRSRKEAISPLLYKP